MGEDLLVAARRGVAKERRTEPVDIEHYRLREGVQEVAVCFRDPGRSPFAAASPDVSLIRTRRRTGGSGVEVVHQHAIGVAATSYAGDASRLTEASVEDDADTMRLALVSDQHGNDVAFRAALEDIERIGVDQIVCLGDVVQGGCQPAATLDRLRSLDCPTVLGNADAFLLEVPSNSPEPVVEQMLEVREWTLSQLDTTHVDLIRSFQPTVTLTQDGTSMLFFHGSPRSFDDVLLPRLPNASVQPYPMASLEEYQGYGVDLLAGGHTHKQWTRRIDAALFVNPGSIGYVYDVNRNDEGTVVRPVAEYALVIVDDQGPAVEFRQVAYSTQELYSRAKASGRPHIDDWMGQWADR